MFNISSLLSRYRDFTPPEAAVKKAVIEAVKEAIGVELTNDQLSAQGFSFNLKTSPRIRGEVFLNKAKILAILERKLASKAPRDIR